MTGFYGEGLYVDTDTGEDVWLHFHHPDHDRDGNPPSFRGNRKDCPLDHCGDVDLSVGIADAGKVESRTPNRGRGEVGIADVESRTG